MGDENETQALRAIIANLQTEMAELKREKIVLQEVMRILNQKELQKKITQMIEKREEIA